MIITRKIQLDFTIKNREGQNEIWKILRKLNYSVFQASNEIVNSQFFNEVYLFRQHVSDYKFIDEEMKSLKKQFADKKISIEEKKEILYVLTRDRIVKERINEKRYEYFKKEFDVSIQHSSYDVIKQLYPDIPPKIRAALNYRIFKDFKNDLLAVKNGLKTLRTYRKNIPIPFMVEALKISVDERNRFVLKWLLGINFYLHFGKDDSKNQEIILKILSGEYKAGISSIQIKEDKVFLLLSVNIPDKTPTGLNPAIAVGVDLGITIPAYCALSIGKNREALGNSNDFLRVRLQMQARRKRLYNAIKLNQGGKGKNKKLKVLKKIEECERNFVNTYNHNISKKVIQFAEKNGAGTIKLELLTGIGLEKRNNHILRNWSFFELQTMIKYKAERAGIRVVYVDAYHTSTQCGSCGNHEPKQRIDQTTFICKNPKCDGFDKKVSADYNAALNIAKSKKIVTHKSETQSFQD
jgi:putative transposase